jgi:hypothetical protein
MWHVWETGENTYMVLVEQLRKLGISWSRREDNIKMVLKLLHRETGYRDRCSE